MIKMNKILRNIIIPTLFLAGSAATWMACSKAPEEEPVRQEAAAADSLGYVSMKFVSKVEKADNAKFLYLNTGTINYGHYRRGSSHEFQMATFELPNGEVDLLVPFSRHLMPNRRYSIEYETLDPAKAYTAQEFASRFLGYKDVSVPEVFPDFELDPSLDGILKTHKAHEELR